MFVTFVSFDFLSPLRTLIILAHDTTYRYEYQQNNDDIQIREVFSSILTRREKKKICGKNRREKLLNNILGKKVLNG